MDSTTALNAANYKVYKAPNTYTTLAGDAEFYDGASIVAIKLDKDLYAKAKAAATLIVSNVKDLAGNVIKDTDKVKTISDQTLEDALELKTVTGPDAVVATGLKTIVLTFNQEIESCENDGIIVKNGGNVTNSESVVVNGNKVTATFKNAITSFDFATITATASYKKGKIHGRLGDPSADESTLTITDKIAPSIVSIAKGDGKITIKFDKALNVNNDAAKIAHDIQVFAKKDADGDYVKLDAFVTKEITMGNIADDTKTLAVTIDTTKVQLDSPFKVVVKGAEYVVSKAGTPVADQEFVSADNDGDAEAFDFKAPVVTEVKTTALDSTHVTVEITFSEKVVSAAALLADGDVTLDSANAAEAPTLPADGLTLTAKFAVANYQDTKVLSVVAGKFKDIADVAANVNVLHKFKLTKGSAEIADDVWTIQP